MNISPLESLPNILIVDDIIENLKLLEAIFSKINANLIMAISGAEALEKTNGIKLALAILDVRMPEMDGFELAAKLNEHRTKDKVPIIFLTANGKNKDELLSGYNSGAVDYIEKPINQYIVISKINIFLDLFNQKQEIIRDAELLKQKTEELAQVNAALKKSEEKYRSFIENAPDGVFVIDKNGRYNEVNDAACKITGYSKDELLGMTISDILSEESQQAGLADFRKLVKTGFLKTDLPYKHKNRDKYWLALKAVKLSETQFLGFTSDITHRIKMEESLRSYQFELEIQNGEKELARKLAQIVSHKYTELYDFAPSGYLSLSKDSKITELNLAAAKMLGKERLHLINSRFTTFLSENTRSVFRLFFDKVFTSKIKQTCEVTIETEGVLPIYVNIEGIVNQKDEICLLTLIDITERFLAKVSLQDSEEKYKRTIESISDAFFLLDKDFRFSYFNKHAEKLLFKKSNEVLGKQIFNEVFTEAKGSLFEEKYTKALNENIALNFETFFGTEPYNNWYEVRVYPGDYGISVFFTVITERKRAEQALRLANDVLSNMQLGMYVYHLEDIDNDRSLRLISANPASELMTGVKASDIIGNTLDENFPYLRKMGFPQRYAEVVRNGKARIFEDIVYSDNRIMRTFFSVKAFPLPDNHLGIAFENITEKVQAQNEIAESNNRLNLAQEIGNVGSWELDFITSKVTWSDHTFKIYEENPDSFEVNFENIVSHYPKGDKENVVEALNRTFIEKKDLYIEHEVFTGKGNTRYVLESGRMILSEEGEPLKLVGSVADITGLKKAENDLRKSRDLFQQISRMTKAGGWFVDLVTGEHNWTDLKREIHEVGPDFIPNMENAINFYEEGENREKITKLIAHCIKTGEPFDTEAQIITAKGNRRWVRTMGSAGFLDGKCVGLTGTFQDITQRRQAEQALKISDEKYKTMLNASPDGILIINKKGIITEVSEIGIELLGADNRSELIGKHFKRLIPSEENSTIHMAIEKTNNEGIAQNIEIRIKKKNQSLFLSEISLTLIQDSYGVPFSFMTTIRDISQRKKMEKKIIHADRMASLGEMASGIAHEINQPLNTISFVMDNILYEAAKDGNIEKNYFEKKSKKIFENIIRIKNIIDHIRDFSRSRDDYILTGFDINSSINNAVTMLAEQFKHLSINLSLELEENLPLIIGNTFNFEQVVLNMLSNSKDALLEKKSKRTEDFEMFIKVKSFRENQCLVIEFIDNGVGISNEDIDNIMLPFYTTKDTGKGTGLGLSISYHIIKEMNGSIEIASNIFGGVTFRIILLIQNNT